MRKKSPCVCVSRKSFICNSIVRLSARTSFRWEGECTEGHLINLLPLVAVFTALYRGYFSSVVPDMYLMGGYVSHEISDLRGIGYHTNFAALDVASSFAV